MGVERFRLRIKSKTNSDPDPDSGSVIRELTSRLWKRADVPNRPSSAPHRRSLASVASHHLQQSYNTARSGGQGTKHKAAQSRANIGPNALECKPCNTPTKLTNCSPSAKRPPCRSTAGRLAGATSPTLSSPVAGVHMCASEPDSDSPSSPT